MKRSKLFISVVVIGLVLSFAITAVAADFDPQTEAERGVAQIGSIMAQDSEGQRHDVSAYTVQLEDTAVKPDVIMADGDPLSPIDQWVLSKTPKFWFVKTPGATRYKIELRNSWSGNLVYTYKGVGNCTDVPGICWLQPPTKLKTYEYFNWDNGDYQWRLGFKVGGVWYYSAYYGFGVLSKGFNSTFNTDMKKWYPITGEWFQASSGYLKSIGIPNVYTSSMQKEFFLTDYGYEVRMKGKTANQIQGIIVAGMPDPLGTAASWYDGVYLLNSNGYTGVWIIENGVQLIWTGWMNAPYVDPTGWNTLQLVVDAPNAYLFINDHLDWMILNFTGNIIPGYVGLVHEKVSLDPAKLVVDWAKLYYVTQPALTDLESNLDSANVLDLTNLPADGLQNGSPFNLPE